MLELGSCCQNDASASISFECLADMTTGREGECSTFLSLFVSLSTKTNVKSFHIVQSIELIAYAYTFYNMYYV